MLLIYHLGFMCSLSLLVLAPLAHSVTPSFKLTHSTIQSLNHSPQVVDLFLREWTATPIGLCCPLYAEAYKKHKRDRAPR
jgi:hypothetical protein